MRYAAMLRDSIRESLDRRSFHITAAAFGILILLCASIGFESHSMERTIQEFLVRHEDRTRHPSFEALEYRVREARPAESEAGSGEFLVGVEFRLDAGPPDRLQKVALAWRALPADEKTSAGRVRVAQVPGLSPDLSTILEPPSREEVCRFIETTVRTVRDPATPVKAVLEEQDGQRWAFRVSCNLPRAWVVRGHDVHVLFGAWTLDRPFREIRESVFFIQDLLAGYIVGWIGVLVGIVVTAAFIPNMLQQGMLDLILSRPVRRVSVLLTKFLGGLTFIFASATFLIGGCWVAMGLRSGTWAPGFLLAIPLLLFFFAALYSISTLIGFLSRSATQAILASVLAWVALSSLGTLHTHLPKLDEGPSPVARVLIGTANVAHAILPPLREIDKATQLCLLKANGITPYQFAWLPRQRGSYPDVDWGRLFGITGAWMAGLLSLACWRFSRRDY